MAKKTEYQRPSVASNKDEALTTVINDITVKHGKGSLLRAGNVIKDVETISTGSLSLDVALGVGGLPRGRITEIYGPEASGKTTLALHVVAMAQKIGGNCAFIDVEHALDLNYASNLGVNIESLLLSQPDYGEQALNIAEDLIRSGAIDVVVVDSVASLVPRAELDGEVGDHHVGAQARLMTQALRKLTAAVQKTNTILIFINQLREKIGIMFGNPESTPGGRALKFFASVRIDIRRTGSFGNTGNHVKCKIAKNKVAAPFTTCEFDIYFGKGISREADLLNLAVQHDVIQKKSSYYYHNDESIGNGAEKTAEYLKDNPEFTDEIESVLRSKLFPHKQK